MCGVEGGAAGQFLQGGGSDEDGPGAGEAQSDGGAWQLAGIAPAGGEVVLCLGDEVLVEGSEGGFVFWVEEVFWLEREFGEFLAWQVAATLLEVGGEVAEDIDELEAFSEADAIFDHGVEVHAGVGVEFSGADAGPELAYATGDAPGIVIEFLEVFEGVDLAGLEVLEALEVEGLAAGDDFEYLLDVAGVIGWGLVEGGEGFVDTGQEFFFCGVGLVGCELAEVGSGVLWGGVEDMVSQLIEGVEALVDGDDGRIGDGVGGAGEEVGEADGLSDWLGEDTESQVERA